MAALVSAPMAQPRSVAGGVRDDVGVGLGAAGLEVGRRRDHAADGRRRRRQLVGRRGRRRLGPLVEQPPGQLVAPGAVRGVGVGHLGEDQRVSRTPTSARPGRRTRRARRARRPGPSAAPRPGSRSGLWGTSPRCERPAAMPADMLANSRASAPLSAAWASRASSRWAFSSRRRSRAACPARLPGGLGRGANVVPAASWRAARWASWMAARRPPVSMTGSAPASPARSPAVSAAARSSATRSGSGAAVSVAVDEDADAALEDGRRLVRGAARKAQRRRSRRRHRRAPGGLHARDPIAGSRARSRPLSWVVDNSTGGLHP